MRKEIEVFNIQLDPVNIHIGDFQNTGIYIVNSSEAYWVNKSNGSLWMLESGIIDYIISGETKSDTNVKGCGLNEDFVLKLASILSKNEKYNELNK